MPPPRRLKPTGVKARRWSFSVSAARLRYARPHQGSRQGRAGQGIRALHPKHGHPALREAVAEHIKRQTGVSYDPKTEVMITCGGQQAILLTMKAVLEPGDEVLLPSPGYGLYYNCASIADAQVRAYALKAPDFGWGGAEAGERTKMLFINSPHNPTGRGSFQGRARPDRRFRQGQQLAGGFRRSL